MTTQKKAGMREGFSLVEVMISIVLLAIILIALAGMTFQTAQRSVQLSDASTRQALLLQEVNRVSAVPLGTVSALAGCDSVFTGPHRFERCVAVADIGHVRQVTITLRSPKLSHPDSVVFSRALISACNPLAGFCP
jgi:prepilin-type N-terminal cleavage/methylation domain-containing protein